MGNKIFLWVNSLKAYALIASVVPVLILFVIARANGALIGFADLLLMLIGVLSVHLATHFVNEYHFYKKGIDSTNKLSTSMVLANGLLKTKQIISLIILLYGISVFITTYFVLYSSFNLVWFVLLGLAGSYYYTAGKSPLKHVALGEFMLFFLLGPLVFLAIYFAFSAEISFRAFLFSIPIGLQITAIFTANNIKNMNAANSKELLVVRGIEKAKRLYYAELLFPYLFMFFLVIIRVNHISLLIVFLSIMRTVKLIIKMKNDHLSEGIAQETAQVQMFFSTLLLFGLLLESWFK
ncbi:MAG: prenyltransferase [Candidatus Riflemargulisbacteria bacterium]